MHLYATGGVNGLVASVTTLAGWPRQATTRAAGSAPQLLSWRELVAAAMLHTELASAIAEHKPADTAFHLEKARDLLKAAGRSGDHDSVDATTRRWYYVVIHLYTSQQRTSEASWYAREGLLRFPRDPMLYVARGAIAETSVQPIVSDLRRDLPLDGRLRARVEQMFKLAVLDYQQALGIDGGLAAAHLRIGWTRLFTHDGRARDALEAAVEHADNDATRYLAHLFLGGAHEQAQRLEDARREYEAAVAVGPRFQTGYIALSHLEEALGHVGRARELAIVCAQLVKHDDDPWWDYRIGFDRTELLRLRAEAQQ